MNNQQIFTKVYNSLIEDGLLADIKGTHLKLLIALCSYMDKDGVCYPSLERLARDTGLSVKNVQRYLTGKNDGLINYRFKGEPLVELKEKRKGATCYYNVYRVLPASRVGKFNSSTTVEAESENDYNRYYNKQRDAFIYKGKEFKSVGDLLDFKRMIERYG